MTALDEDSNAAVAVQGGADRRGRVALRVAAGGVTLAIGAVLFLHGRATSGACRAGHCAPAGQGATIDVAVSMQNYRIDLPHHLTAGRTRFVVTNIGPTMHEFNLARTRSITTSVPVSADGTVDDHTEHADFAHLGEVEGIDLGQRKMLTVALTPGTYVVYCNMDGHYLAGMTERVTVTA